MLSSVPTYAGTSDYISFHVSLLSASLGSLGLHSSQQNTTCLSTFERVFETSKDAGTPDKDYKTLNPERLMLL